VVSELLKELNPDVAGDFVSGISVTDYISTRVEEIKKYQLIVAADLENVRNSFCLMSLKIVGFHYSSEQNLHSK
jgi:hypothetical protein